MPVPYDPTRRTKASASVAARMAAAMVGQSRRSQRCPDTPRLDDRLALVTGGTGGIGAEIVEGLAARGADVIVAARGTENSDKTCTHWSARTGRSIRFLRLDLGSLAGVRDAVAALSARGERRPVSILCANAGIWPKHHGVSPDGYEQAFATNCLGHHLLIRLMMENGTLAPDARIVGTTGDIYVMAKDCTPDFTYRGGGLQAYCRSKLGNLWQFAELARRYPALHVVSVHPGVVASGLEGPTTGIGGAVKTLLMLSTEDGAQASLIGATQDLPSGSYFHNVMGLVDLPPTDRARDAGRAAAFWDDLERLADLG